MNQKQAEKAMLENRIDNFAVDPRTKKVSVKRPSVDPGPTNWPDANPTKRVTDKR